MSYTKKCIDWYRSQRKRLRCSDRVAVASGFLVIIVLGFWHFLGIWRAASVLLGALASFEKIFVWVVPRSVRVILFILFIVSSAFMGFNQKVHDSKETENSKRVDSLSVSLENTQQSSAPNTLVLDTALYASSVDSVVLTLFFKRSKPEEDLGQFEIYFTVPSENDITIKRVSANTQMLSAGYIGSKRKQYIVRYIPFVDPIIVVVLSGPTRLHLQGNLGLGGWWLSPEAKQTR